MYARIVRRRRDTRRRVTENFSTVRIARLAPEREYRVRFPTPDPRPHRTIRSGIANTFFHVRFRSGGIVRRFYESNGNESRTHTDCARPFRFGKNAITTFTYGRDAACRLEYLVTYGRRFSYGRRYRRSRSLAYREKSRATSGYDSIGFLIGVHRRSAEETPR